MAARQKPKFLPGLGKRKVHETLSGNKIRRAAQDGESVRTDSGEVVRQDEAEIGPASRSDLRKREKIDGESIGGFSQGNIFGRAAGDSIELPDVAADLRQDLPAALPT